MQRYLDYEQIKKNRRNSMIIVILFGIVGFLILYGISNYYEMGTTFTVVSLIVSIVMTYITYSMSHITVIASVGARKADVTLVNKINEAFYEMYKEGKFQEVSNKWFGEDVATEELKSK